MKVGITGANGFLGWHLRIRLALEGHDVRTATRETFAGPEALNEFVDGLDTIVHAAGVNRANDAAEITSGNRDLAADLVEALDTTASQATVIYTNSTQSEADNLYGNAKREAASILAQQQARLDAGFVDLVLPHLFGEFGRPFYNSAVTTFAHLLATGGEPTINDGGTLELVHAQQVAEQILPLLSERTSRRIRVEGHQCSVRDAWELLAAQHQRYVDEGTIPDTSDAHELRMFNTLRSQLYAADLYPVNLTLHADERGAFSEMARADGLGQTSISTSVPGITRGDHYHLDKIERFVVIRGQARIRVRQLLTDEIKTYDVSGDAPMVIDMPTLCTHNITNTGDSEMVTLFWAADHFDPSHPDTFPEPVKQERDTCE